MPARHPPPLPLLSERELAEHFGDDQAALRRYRLLHAVLIKGMTQREAAASYGVSERTIRNVLRKYATGDGLDALRSRGGPTQRRRGRSWVAGEQVLATALAEDPQAGGDRLWRRAQELLGASGPQLSRRTAYRILAHLRAGREEEDDPPNSLRGLVRAALPLLPEDPPLALGASPLAQHLLPEVGDALLRGSLLQQALRTALDSLRPPGAVSVIDRSWWPYLICTGEYETGQSRAELEADLALSASTYSRAKRQGLDQIVARLPQIITQLIETPTALANQRLPRTPDFIGRHEEQSYYAWRLQTEGLAHIWGLPGSGKTALAAELAAEGRRYGQLILWHTCAAGPDSTLVGIITGLAKALTAAGDDLLWRQIRHMPVDAPDPQALLDLLRERLLVRPAVVVLDDAHRVDPRETAALFDMLADLLVRRSTRLVLVGRTPLEATRYPPLRGLSEREARLLWAGAPALPAEQWAALYEATAGLPRPIRRVASAYRRAGALARPTDWLDEVTAWARDELWDRLDEDDRRLLVAAYALEPRSWAGQAALLCETLSIPMQTPVRLRQLGLLTISGASVRPLGALRPCLAARLHDDASLRAQLEALAPTLDTTDPAALDTAADPDILKESGMGAEPAATPTGLELLSRVREALQVSAAYLHERSGDWIARQLAVELEALQEALPDPAGPHSPPGSP